MAPCGVVERVDVVGHVRLGQLAVLVDAFLERSVPKLSQLRDCESEGESSLLLAD